jgi:hypothetical protein
LTRGIAANPEPDHAPVVAEFELPDEYCSGRRSARTDAAALRRRHKTPRSGVICEVSRRVQGRQRAAAVERHSAWSSATLAL